MRDLPVYFAVIAFAAMGFGALAKPRVVTAQLGIVDLTAAGRNEVRAVYGGFGVMVAAVLLVAVHQASLRAGILVTVASALGGMAGGRVISAAVDRGIDAGPRRYLILEVAVAIMLLAAV